MARCQDPSDSHCVELGSAVLRRWPLPELSPDADKEARGAVLVVAGSQEMPGAAVLAATAALRAGAGKVVIGTAASVAVHVGTAVPEARVISLPETRAGGISRRGIGRLRDVIDGASAVLIGPGMIDAAATTVLVRSLLEQCAVPVLLDAVAMDGAVGQQRVGASALLMTPRAGEMAHLMAVGKDAVLADPLRWARSAAQRWEAVVVLKGACTVIANATGEAWRHQSATVGLATCGSGDVLAGISAGLLARGAAPEQAAAWGVVLHARAGRRLAARGGSLGYLARELAEEVPSLQRSFCRGR